jgi:predicted aspartyl protease
MIAADDLRKIGIEPTGKRVYEMANGQWAEFEVGAAQISFCEETFPVRVIFGPDGCEPILGVIALESAGFMIDPKNQTLTKLKVFPLKKVAAAIAVR